MMNRARAQVLILVPLAIAAISSIGCGPPPPPQVAHVPASLAGIYNGTHTLSFEITAPVPRPMNPDQQAGPIHVNESANGAVQVSLRLYQDGDPCHLDGQRQGGSGRVLINPGQRCSIRLLYEGTPVIAGMQINSGVADFESYNLTTDMSGPFVAEAYVSGQRTSVQGNARISFSGTRQADR